ncbi:hypothetical protein CK203_037588 [Vitis vinifera]|uniref:Uncharacterized protein n=1 Tax=Vitis vinifera TaxID=29760 RepID=A0A438HM71_VITVI|nr:hypothetical protein CK203_037588 [Vitis vinifera]
MATARTVKDVSPHEFVNAYAAHLKRSGKVYFLNFSLCTCVYGVFHYQAGLRACLDLGKMREREWKFLRIEAFLIRYKGSAMAG